MKEVAMKSWNHRKSCLIILSTFIFILYILAFYCDLKVYDIVNLRKIIVGDIQASNATKTILFWNTMFDDETFYMGRGDIFRDCPVNDCYATHDHDYMDVRDFDAVLFHGIEQEPEDLPTKRSPRQWFVFVNLESPANRPLVHPVFKDYFNLTMTYRLDSDVVWPYGLVRDIITDQIVAPLRNTSWVASYNRTDGKAEDVLSEVIEGKKLAVIWFVSNCRAKSGRQEYVNDLSEHITVDVYGNCGSQRCPRSTDCFANVAEPNYFFYLSFENSFCQDYVTEKLYNALRYNIVPIVYGGANYSIFAPRNSYIDALDFDTPKDLAKYLRWLMKNPTEYRKYFEWKKYYRVEITNHHMACNLCKFLHEQKQTRTNMDLFSWYSNEKCPLQRFLSDEKKYLTGAMLKNQD